MLRPHGAGQAFYPDLPVVVNGDHGGTLRIGIAFTNNGAHQFGKENQMREQCVHVKTPFKARPSEVLAVMHSRRPAAPDAAEL